MRGLSVLGCKELQKLKVSAFLLDLVIRNVKGEITRDEVSQLLDAHYTNMPKTERKRSHGLDGDYEIIPPDSPRHRRLKNTIESSARHFMLSLISREKERNSCLRTRLPNLYLST